MDTFTQGGEQGIAYLKHGQTPGQAYKRWRNALTEQIARPGEKHREFIARVQADLLKQKDVGPAAVQDNRFLANVSRQYRNDDYIGMMLMPAVPVPNLSGQYPTYNKRDRLAAPDDSMSNRAQANEISDTRGTGTYSCGSYALKNFVSVLTLRNQVAPLDEMVDLTEAVTDTMQLKEEIRIATKMTTSGNYDASTVQTLTGSNRWDSSTGGNPIKNIQDAMASLWSGRGPSKLIGWCSLDVWNVLARHPAILDLFKYGGSTPGLAGPGQIADYFGLDGMLVSKSRYDTANEGQTASYSRIWGKYFGIARVADRGSLRNAAFGNTLRFQEWNTRVWFDPNVSTMGGYYAQVAVHEDHNILANDTGALVVSPIS